MQFRWEHSRREWTTCAGFLIAVMWVLLAAGDAFKPVTVLASGEVKRAAATNLGNIGTFEKWSKMEIELAGPNLTSDGNPNPFAIEVNVTFTGPQGQSYIVPAFFDGDGAGGPDGNVWKVRFSPDGEGSWSFSSASGEAALAGYTGTFTVTPPTGCTTYQPGGLPDFGCVGRLESVDAPYLKFVDGGYWLKGGADEPEDFLGPDETAGMGSKEAAVDYLAGKDVNSIYILLHNIDGDGKNVWPWLDRKNDTTRFDVAKLAEWESIFSYIQAKGLVLHLVFEDDSAWNDFERDAYYREMVARFAHHNGLYWNVAEEYNELYSPEQVSQFAAQIRAIDPYDHPVAVHNQGNPQANWQSEFVGETVFDLSSIQTLAILGNTSDPTTGDPDPANVNQVTVDLYNAVAANGHIIPIMIDEPGQFGPEDRTLSREVVWATYLGGGNIEIFTKMSGLSYQDYSNFFDDMTRARRFMEEIPYWQLQPANNLLTTGAAYVLANANNRYVAYLPAGGTVGFDFTNTPNDQLRVTWFNPRDGSQQVNDITNPKAVQQFTAPDGQDWVLMVAVIDVDDPVTPSDFVYLPVLLKP